MYSLNMKNVKGQGLSINSSQSKNVGKLFMQLSHLSINLENIWGFFIL